MSQNDGECELFRESGVGVVIDQEIRLLPQPHLRTGGTNGAGQAQPAPRQLYPHLVNARDPLDQRNNGGR